MKVLRKEPLVLGSAPRYGLALLFLAAGVFVAGVVARALVVECAGAECRVLEEGALGGRALVVVRAELKAVKAVPEGGGCQLVMTRASGEMRSPERPAPCALLTGVADGLERWRAQGTAFRGHVDRRGPLLTLGGGMAFVGLLLGLGFGRACRVRLDAEGLLVVRAGPLGLGREVSRVQREALQPAQVGPREGKHVATMGEIQLMQPGTQAQAERVATLINEHL